jgi:hypothetical protein
MNRFHSKFHRKNHHTNTDPYNPDAGHDPIASPDAPFQGIFCVNGNLSSSGGLTVSGFNISRGYRTVGFTTLVAGSSALVTTTAIQASSIVLLTPQTSSVNIGTPFIRTRIPSVSFTISSTHANDRSTIGWFILQTQ